MVCAGIWGMSLWQEGNQEVISKHVPWDQPAGCEGWLLCSNAENQGSEISHVAFWWENQNSGSLTPALALILFILSGKNYGCDK